MSNSESDRVPLLDWQRVRRLSQLTLLNRITLLLLVAIPMVVAVWPKYQDSVLRYNRTLDAARQKFNLQRPPSTDSIPPKQEDPPKDQPAGAQAPLSTNASSESDASTSNADAASADSAISRDAVSLDEESQVQALEPIAGAGGYIRAWGMDQPLLETRVEANWIDPLPQNRQLPIIPRTWAMAFMAALFILIGDTLRQLFCPSIVRDFSLTDYVDSRVQLFSSAPSSATFSRALQEIRQHTDQADPPKATTASSGDVAAGASTAPSKETSKETSAAPSEEELPEHLDALHGSTGASPVSLGKIESASRLTYQTLSARRPFAILLSIIAYVVAVGIITKIIQEQTINVLSAAGWI